MTTMRAAQPICFHKETGSQPMAGAAASWKSQRPNVVANVITMELLLFPRLGTIDCFALRRPASRAYWLRVKFTSIVVITSTGSLFKIVAL